MRRRHLFPAILLSTSIIWSLVAASASAPTQSYDYLNALVGDDAYALGSRWVDAKLSHADKVSDQDETNFLKMLEAFDAPIDPNGPRQFFIGQAKFKRDNNICIKNTEPCQTKIRINQTLEPVFIHGDLRFVQAVEQSISQKVTLFKDKVEYGEKTEEARQVRYMLTERGWVIKSVETLQEQPHHKYNSAPLKTEKISGLNYYPQAASWEKFWAEFPIEDIEQDMDAVRKLGSNAVRIFLQHEYFANLETQDDGLSKLVAFLDLCRDRNIRVIVTLFDLRPDYRLQNWGRDSMHLTTILDTISDHEALLAVDLKNQPDLDFASFGEPSVTAWLEAMITSARQNHADIPLTIGWSDPTEAHNLSNQVSLVSFHDYNDPSGLSMRLNNVRNKVGNKPVFVTEIGHSRWSPLGDKSMRQSDRLSQQLNALKTADGVFVWTLNDFDDIGSNIVGHRPWRKAQQKAYGITRHDGSWRPSADALHIFNQTFLSNQTGD